MTRREQRLAKHLQRALEVARRHVVCTCSRRGGRHRENCDLMELARVAAWAERHDADADATDSEARAALEELDASPVLHVWHASPAGLRVQDMIIRQKGGAV